MNLDELSTPALVLDQGRLRRNCEAMHARMRQLGTRLRPHMKTLKSLEATRLAVDPRHGGIAVSTFAEAEYFAEAGYSDIQLALCPPPGKLERIPALLALAPGFSFFLDSCSMAEAVVRCAASSERPLNVWIEIDCGEHRTGVLPEDPELLRIAQTLTRSDQVNLVGVATHAGQSYQAVSPEEMTQLAEVERSAVVLAAERLAAAGLPVPNLSAGSTPTAVHSRSAERLTELRAGVFMAGDLFQVGIGSLAAEDMALTVLASVISHNRAHNQIVVDAGALALSKDRSTAALGVADAGYGAVLDLDGVASLGPLTVGGVHQEHGEIRSPMPLPFDRMPVGSKVRIAVNHACITAAMYSRYDVVDGGRQVLASWARVSGWER